MKCLRCGTTHKKRLVALVQPGTGPAGPPEIPGDTFGPRPGLPTEFYVCRNRKACRGRQQAERPARMKVNEIDLWNTQTHSSGNFPEAKAAKDKFYGARRED